MNIRDSATSDWSVIRTQITQAVLGKIPQHKREPLDVVDAIHLKFPGFDWLEIASWMDGSKLPTDVQQLTLCNWVQSLADSPQTSASDLTS